MLVLLLYCTGMRFGEPLRLTVDDVDLEQRVLRVRESKGKTRLVPFRDDLARELERYHRARPSAAGREAAFLCQPNGRPYGVTTASGVVTRLLRQLGLKPPRGRSGPRPFDLRHSFAVRRLTCWYRAGADLQAKLPLLSAYMGHDDLLGTEWYLRATPELLATASRRFAARAGMGTR
jgi:integrase